LYFKADKRGRKQEKLGFYFSIQFIKVKVNNATREEMAHLFLKMAMILQNIGLISAFTGKAKCNYQTSIMDVFERIAM